MIQSAITVSIVPEAKGGPFVFWDDLEAAFGKASALGFDAMEIFPPSAAELSVESLEALKKQYSLKIAAIGTGAGWVKHKLRLTDPDPAIRERAVEFVSQIIRVAGAVGASAIIGSMQGRWGDGVSREQACDWLAEALTRLGPIAREQGRNLFYEPLNRYETNLFCKAADAAAYLDERKIEGVTLLCDLFHMNIEEQDIAAALHKVAHRLGHVHLADSNRQAIGWGHTEMAPIAAVLKEIGYNGYVAAECLPLPDGDAAARQTIQSFRRWFR